MTGNTLLPDQSSRKEPALIPTTIEQSRKHVFFVRYSNIMTHLEKHSLLSHLQHGFRKGFSCESQLILNLHDLVQNSDHKLQTNPIPLDFSKAFDSAPHQSLFLELASYTSRTSVQLATCLLCQNSSIAPRSTRFMDTWSIITYTQLRSLLIDEKTVPKQPF